MAVWFDGQSGIDCHIDDVARALADPGALFTAVVGRMPGLTNVELVEQSGDSVTIQTNEGVMDRSNISIRIEPSRAALEFDERYEAGSTVTTTGHFSHEFTASDDGVTHRLVMTDVEASGLLGFFYRKLGSSKTGNAFLDAYRAHLESQHS